MLFSALQRLLKLNSLISRISWDKAVHQGQSFKGKIRQELIITFCYQWKLRLQFKASLQGEKHRCFLYFHVWHRSEHGCVRKLDATDRQYSPQRHDPSSCCTSSSFVWHWKHRRLLFCLDRLVSSGLSLLSSSSRGRFTGEASLSDCESVVFTTNILGKILEFPCWGIPLGRLKVYCFQLGSPPSSVIISHSIAFACFLNNQNKHQVKDKLSLLPIRTPPAVTTEYKMNWLASFQPWLGHTEIHVEHTPS